MRKAGIILILSGAVLLMAGFLQPPRVSEHILLEPGRIDGLIAQMLPQDASGWQMDTSQLDGREILVNLSIPRYIYRGSRGHMDVTVQIGQVAEVVPGDPANFPADVAFSARLDGSEGSVEPAGLILHTAGTSGKPAFFWNVTDTGGGQVEGSLWLYLVLNAGEAGFFEIPILARDVSIPVKPLAGMALTTSRLTGAGLLLSGLLLFGFKKISIRK